jgi:tetratricopeptide (TPR) repeat protein
MADPQGFSATKFIRKQYNKDSSSSAIPNPTPDDVKKSAEELSPEAIKAILKQYLDSAEKHNKEGQIWEAIGMYNAALHLAPQDLDILQSLANCYVKANARIKSVETFTRIAGVYERQGQVEKVNEVYEKIYGIDPNNKLACSVLGRKPGQDAPSLDMYTTPAVEEKPQIAEVPEPVQETAPETKIILLKPETRDQRP